MRLALLALGLAVLAVAAVVETQHFQVSAPDNGTAASLGAMLEEAYSFYLGRGLQPAPPCGGGKYPVQYPAGGDAGDTYVGAGCVERLTFQQVDRHLAFHEVGHVFHLSYVSGLYDWYWEAIPEAMASIGTGDYRLAALFFSQRLWTVDPRSASQDSWYSYSAAFVWLLGGLDGWGEAVGYASRYPYRAYVRFLLALAGGVEMGGRVYRPDYVEERLLGSLSLPGPAGAYAAVYYNISLIRPGYVVVGVEGPAAVNLAVGRPFYVDNGTLLLAVVANGSGPIRVTVSYWLELKVVGGSYRDGVVSLDLYARYMGAPLDGQLYINGTAVSFSGGSGRYSFAGELRPYLLVASYGGASAALRVNLTAPGLAARPGVLYLGEGGGGLLNVTVSNPNPISLSCLLNGTAAGGVAFTAVRLEVPPGGTAGAGLAFRVTGKPVGPLRVSCGGASASVEVRPLWYRLRYDADAGRGSVETPLGVYWVGELPAVVNVTAGGYLAAALRLGPPDVAVEVGRPAFDLDRFVFPLRVALGAPANCTFTGTLWVDGRSLGVVTVEGGPAAAVVAANVTASAAREVEVRFGRFAARARLEPPGLNVTLTPVKAVVNGSRVALFLKAAYNVKVVRLPLQFDPQPAASHGDVFVFYMDYAEDLAISYRGPAGGGPVHVHLPRPRLSIRPLNVTVSPDKVEAVVNLTAVVCGPSVDATYVVAIAGRRVASVEAPGGGCGGGWGLASASAPYSPRVSLSVDTSLGTASAELHVPPPDVAVSLALWRVDGDVESAVVDVEARAPPNYSYVFLGRTLRGFLALRNLTLPVESGAAVLDYGFGRAAVPRPPLAMEARAAVAPLGAPLNLTVVLKAPPNLSLRGVLKAADASSSIYASLPVSLSPGEARAVAVALSPPRSPGVYGVSVSLGPYSTSATAVWASASLRLQAPDLLPVGAPAAVRLVGSVAPPVPVNATVEASGCAARPAASVAPNSSLWFRADRPCVLKLKARMLDAEAEAEVRWASLTASAEVERLGTLYGLPVFAAGSLRPAARLGGRPVEARLAVYGDLAALGYVSLNVTVEYMGVRNSTPFRGYAVPREAYLAALEALKAMPADAAAAFRLAVDAAVVTGQWGAVERISSLYRATPTPMALLARLVVERQLASGQPPDVRLAEGLVTWEMPLYGLAAALGISARAFQLLRRRRHAAEG